jgi:hypothetical protein|tara:strand:+ start:720 stop:863 length:144 start_codon:yes stop_codon:yes gene_type:complete
MATYLLKEGSEEFIVEAKDLKEAEGHAELYNAVVIRKLTKAEEKQIS